MTETKAQRVERLRVERLRVERLRVALQSVEAPAGTGIYVTPTQAAQADVLIEEVVRRILERIKP